MSSGPKITKVPPDGGWGWLVVFGSSVVNMFTRAIEPSFGLLFKDFLIELNVETTGAAVVMGTLDSIINFSGLFVGPLMKTISYRKVAMIGSALSVIAYLSTLFATNMTQLIISFSIIGGLGFGFINASTFVGLNSYFVKRKGQAVGLAMAGTAMGFMAMPQIVSYLLLHYKFRGTLLILSGLSLNTFVGASLFQPVKWHMKTVESKDEKEKPLLNNGNTIKEEDEEEEGGLTLLAPGLENVRDTCDRETSPPKSSIVNHQRTGQSSIKRQNSLVINNLKPPVDSNAQPRKIFQVSSSSSLKRRPSVMSHVSLLDFAGSTVHIDYQDDDRQETEVKPKTPAWLSWIIRIMDLNLLKDPIYLNILYGSSITYVAEFSWKLIVPFFMYDLDFDLQQTATALSTMSVADLVARVAMPPLLDRLPYSRRSTVTCFLVLMAVSRSVVAAQTETVPLMVALVVHGFLRGVTLIGFPLVLSEYSSKDNFPAVLGLSMVAKGIFIAIVAPIIGWVRDSTGSFSLSLHFQSLMILSCVVAWTLELLIVKKKSVDDDELETVKVT
ncbi:Major Facilitator Superfamily [Nesidiocoris tenuis]|uniref:Major Facilitator Superfamily n=1 Tax=Nesidiocoris tenuis TaxID=355587 RepID=A0ABN7B4L3_9HEMI|nr:Major Facilitator Superfamily [Nesidiocoris tenuis]